MRVRTLPTVLPHAQKRVRGERSSLITPQWFHTTNDATPVTRHRAGGRGVVDVVWWTWCSGNMPGFQPGVVGSIPTVRTGSDANEAGYFDC
jgi:hypothetical protein